MRTTTKSTILWGENKMKILEDYKKIAQELLFEVDDEKMIKYKDKDGESKEMKAGSAKTMPADHPAKQAWDKISTQDGDGGDDKEAPSDKKLGKGDFDRDSGAEKDKVMGKDADRDGGGDDGDKYEGDFEVDTDPKKYDGLESYEVSMAKRADKEIAQHGKFGDGTSLPPGTDFSTKIDDLDEEEVEAFYDAVAEKYAEKHDITMGVMDDNKNYFMDEEGMTMGDLVSGIISSAEEAESEGGYMKYGESVEPKNKPFLKEQLERFGGLK